MLIIAQHTFFLEMFSLLPITFAIFCLLPWLDSIAVKQSNACQGENKPTSSIQILYDMISQAPS